MNAHNDAKRPSDRSLDATLVLAAAQLRFAAWINFLVARWLERCATNARVGQMWFKTDRKPTHEFGMGVNLVVVPLGDHGAISNHLLDEPAGNIQDDAAWKASSSILKPSGLRAPTTR